MLVHSSFDRYVKIHCVYGEIHLVEWLNDVSPFFQVPLVASFSLFMVIAGLTLPRTSGWDSFRFIGKNNPLMQLCEFTDYSLFYYFLLWFWLFAVSILFMMVHGINYVSWPRLNPLTHIIYYNGPGFRSARHGMGVKGNAKAAETRQRTKGTLSGRIEELELGSLKKRVD